MKKKRMSETVKKEGSGRRGAGRRKTVKYTPNTKWLLSLLESKGISQQEISKLTSTDKGTVSKIFRGKVRPSLKIVAEFAAILSTPFDELLSAFGLPALNMPSTNDFLDVTGWLDSQLCLRSAHEESGGTRGLHGSKTAPCPFSDRDIRVARLQTAGSEFDGLDGGLVYYREARSLAHGVNSEMIGRIGLVKVVGEEARRLRVVRRGYTAGKFNLTSLSGRLMEESVVVESVYPIIWLKF